MTVTQSKISSNTHATTVGGDLAALERAMLDACDQAYAAVTQLWDAHEQQEVAIPPALRILSKAFRAALDNRYDKLASKPYYPLTPQEVSNLAGLPKSAILTYLLAKAKSPFETSQFEISNAELEDALGLSRWSTKRAADLLNATLLSKTPINSGERRGRKSKLKRNMPLRQKVQKCTPPATPAPKAKGATCSKIAPFNQPEKVALLHPTSAERVQFCYSETAIEWDEDDSSEEGVEMHQIAETKGAILLQEAEDEGAILLPLPVKKVQNCYLQSLEEQLQGDEEDSQLDPDLQLDLNPDLNQGDPRETYLPCGFYNPYETEIFYLDAQAEGYEEEEGAECEGRGEPEAEKIDLSVAKRPETREAMLKAVRLMVIRQFPENGGILSADAEEEYEEYESPEDVPF